MNTVLTLTQNPMQTRTNENYSAPAARPLPRYSVIDLGTLAGGTVSEATALNNHNQVVGWSNLGSVRQAGVYMDKSSFRHGFLWENGQMRDMNPEDGLHIRLPRAINDAGTVVGNLFPLGSPSRCFCQQKDGFSYPSLQYASRAEAINASGYVAGAYVGDGESVQTALFRPDTEGNLSPTISPLQLMDGLHGGSIRSLNNHNEGAGFALQFSAAQGRESKQAVRWDREGVCWPIFAGAEETSVATGINAAGVIVGYRDADGTGEREGRTAFLRTETGEIVTLDCLPGATQSEACDLNNAGQVVGFSGGRAFLWDTEQGACDLNDLIPADSGWTLLRANAINAGGAIVGQGIIGGNRRAFLLLPTALHSVALDSQTGEEETVSGKVLLSRPVASTVEVELTVLGATGSVNARVTIPAWSTSARFSVPRPARSEEPLFVYTRYGGAYRETPVPAAILAEC